MFSNISSSVNKNKKGIILILCSALCTSLGQAFWKLFSEGQILFIIIGFVLYGGGAILMIMAFRFGSLSVLHPLLSLGYLFALFIGGYILNEVISYREVAGIIIILVGVLCVGGGDD